MRHIASSAHGQRSKNPKIIELMKKIVDAVKKLRAERHRKKNL